MRCLTLGLCATLLICLTGSTARSASPYDDLLTQVPADANLLVLIDAERIRTSAFARENQLASDDSTATGDRSIVPPKEVLQAVLAAKIRGFRESLVDWQTALVQMPEPPSLAGLAASYQGSLEQVAGREYVALPNGAMALSLSDKTLTVLHPLDRRRASQGIAQTQMTQKPRLSPYLSRAVAGTSPKSQVLIAIDLKEMFSSSNIFLYLQNAKSFQSRPVDIKVASKLLSSLDGITLRLNFEKTIQADLAVHFSEPADGLSEWVRALFLEILDDTGATIEEVATWTFSPGDKQFHLQGELSRDGLRRVLSLLDFPTHIPKASDPNTPLSPAELKQQTAKASLERFRATQKIWSDLRNPQKTRNLTTAEYGLWYDRYARKIESLPSLHVDKDLLAYCDELVIQLRVLATRHRMVGIKAGSYTRDPNYVVNYFNTWYGTYYETRQAESDFDYVQRVERAAASADKVQTYEAIDQQTLQIRRKMTDRYGVEF